MVLERKSCETCGELIGISQHLTLPKLPLLLMCVGSYYFYTLTFLWFELNYICICALLQIHCKCPKCDSILSIESYFYSRFEETGRVKVFSWDLHYDTVNSALLVPHAIMISILGGQLYFRLLMPPISWEALNQSCGIDLRIVGYTEGQRECLDGYYRYSVSGEGTLHIGTIIHIQEIDSQPCHFIKTEETNRTKYDVEVCGICFWIDHHFKIGNRVKFSGVHALIRSNDHVKLTTWNMDLVDGKEKFLK